MYINSNNNCKTSTSTYKITVVIGTAKRTTSSFTSTLDSDDTKILIK